MSAVPREDGSTLGVFDVRLGRVAGFGSGSRWAGVLGGDAPAA